MRESLSSAYRRYQTHTAMHSAVKSMAHNKPIKAATSLDMFDRLTTGGGALGSGGGDSVAFRAGDGGGGGVNCDGDGGTVIEGDTLGDASGGEGGGEGGGE